MHWQLLTERLALRQLAFSDGAFILRLVNDEAWLSNIGDKNVHTLDDAKRYIEQGPLAMYAEHGFGQMVIESRQTGEAVGLCGLIQRDYLSHPDIGYALLPKFRKQGMAFEACQKVMEDAQTRLGLNTILAIVSPTNAASIALIEKMGMRKVGQVDPVHCPQRTLLFST